VTGRVRPVPCPAASCHPGCVAFDPPMGTTGKQDVPDAVIDKVLLQESAAAPVNDDVALKRDLPRVIQLAVIDVLVLLLWKEHDIGPAQFTKDLSIGVHG
jgi:hypothetical protein